MSSIPPVRAAACGIAIVAACLAPPARGQGRTAQAGGSAEIVGTVSTGAIFDIGSDLLTSIFVTGRAGDTVSLLAPASGLIAANQITMQDDVTIIAGGMVSIDIRQMRRAAQGDDRKSGMVVVLAQFN